MKSFLFIVLILISTTVLAERKIIYSNGVTHTNLIKDNSNYILNTTHQKAKGLYRMKIESIDLVSLKRIDMIKLLEKIISFGEKAKINDSTTHDAVKITYKKQYGVKCIVLEHNGKQINTSVKAIKGALEELKAVKIL